VKIFTHGRVFWNVQKKEDGDKKTGKGKKE